MNTHYNQNYTLGEIVLILDTIKKCIIEGNFTISKNEHRRENIDFIQTYNLNYRKQKDILLRINPFDFCHSLRNLKLGYEFEVLYVFCPRISLYDLEDNQEWIDLYTKFNIIDMNEFKRLVVISFHKRNKPVDYLFR